jgi:hypothetical protein
VVRRAALAGLLAGIGVPGVFLAFLFVAGMVLEIIRNASPTGESPNILFLPWLAALLGPVAGGWPPSPRFRLGP